MKSLLPSVGKSTVPIRFSHITLVLLSLFVYLKIHLSIEGFGVPYFFAHLLAAVFLLKFSMFDKVIYYTTPVIFYLILQYLVTASNFFPPAKSDIQYFGYWLLNFVTVLGFLFILLKCDIRFVYKFSRSFMYIILLIAILEVFFGAKPAIDYIRSLYTSQSTLYVAVERDISLYGAIRPNVFTSEPSSVGNFFGFLAILNFASSRSRIKSFFEISILMAVAIYLIRSPTLMVYLAILPVLSLIVSPGRFTSFAGQFLLVLMFILFLVGPYLIYMSAPGYGTSFFDDFVGTGSYYIRQIAPINTFLTMIVDSPLMGFGYQYAEQAKNINSGDLNYHFGGFYTNDYLQDMHAGQFSTNAFWEFLSVNGVVGSLFLLIVYASLFKRFGVLHLGVLLLSSSMLLFVHAGLILPFTWTPIIGLAYFLVDRKTNRMRASVG